MIFSYLNPFSYVSSKLTRAKAVGHPAPVSRELKLLNMKSKGLISIPAIMGAIALCGGATPHAALAAQSAPGWRLYTDTLPTNLTLGVNEVQSVSSGGEAPFVLGFEGAETTTLEPTASSQEVQGALEALHTIGPENVIVAAAGGPGEYSVTFIHALGSLRVATLESPSAAVSVTTQGSASGTIAIYPINAGASRTAGAIVVTDRLPTGVKAKAAGTLLETPLGENFGVDPQLEPSGWQCTGNGTSGELHVDGATIVNCELQQSGIPSQQGFEGVAGGGGLPSLKPLETLANPQPVIGIEVEAEREAGGLVNEAAIAGGGAPTGATSTDKLTVSDAAPKPGITKSASWQSTNSGLPDDQAGSHPYEATYIFDAATALDKNNVGIVVGSEIRNLEMQLPAGFIGDLHELPRCTRQELLIAECPEGSIVGVITTASFLPIGALQTPIFNMVAEPGQPAELGLKFESISSYIRFSVRSGSDYGIVAHAENLPRRAIYQAMVTIWGVPEDSTHDIWRSLAGAGCTQEELERPRLGDEVNYCVPLQGRTLAPVLTLPTACGGPLETIFQVRGGWQEPLESSDSSSLSGDANGVPHGLTGCEAVPAEVQTSAHSQSGRTDTSSGLEVGVRPNLGGLEAPEGIADATLKGATVTLPPGIVVNPGEAAGLQSCPAGRPSPAEGKYGDAITTAQEAERHEEDAAPAYCPAASKLGTVSISSPLIEADAEHELTGGVYLLPSQPPELGLLIAASGDGVAVKLKGTVHLNETTGQLVTTFTETPPLPFSNLTVSFDGGAKAAIDTPAKCGTYTVGSDFQPWSTPFVSDALSSAGMVFAEGASGGSCVSALPFEPRFSAGSANAQAGGFTDFTMQLQRGDGQQRVEKLQIVTPPGFAAAISSVPQCPEPQAQAGSCPSASQIGHAIVTAGPGPDPLTIPQPGEPTPAIYLTGPYDGAPFGLSIVTQVLAGPFNLGTIVTRAKIEVNPHTAQVTVTTDPLPQIIKGVPTDIRSVYADIDRPGFAFNPTNCSASSVTGTATGATPPGEGGGGATAQLSSRFGIGSCRELAFKPAFTAATSGKTSKADGASLKVKVVPPAQGPGHGSGEEANIGSVKVELPKALPSRLTTLQKACTAAQFDANPAGCPAASRVGMAVAHTPILNSPLVGPAYFVSHGGEAFPQLIVVLQGEGVVVDLVGDTFISKAGITSSTFKEVPDVPVTSFELTLPQGPYSALAANGNLCQQALVMPTSFTSQNGATLKQSTGIEVEGCPNALAFTKHTIKGQTASITVYAPAAGKLALGGKGLKATSKTIKGRETITLKLSQKKAGKLKTTLKATFTPSTGKARRKQTKTLRLQFKK